MSLPSHLLEEVAALTGAQKARSGERVQRLWSGYGEIRRVWLEGAAAPSVIVKRVQPPQVPTHARGWATDRGHARKLRSYAVEMAWYTGFVPDCPVGCRVPRALRCTTEAGAWTFVLEDLDAAGFAERHHRLNAGQLRQCVRWLAQFHAGFLGRAPTDLWPTGTYWHLATRPDELQAMPAGPLRDAATALDARLHNARYRTLVHGDAKVANFCFPAVAGPVAAVDFQYVGGGCGMQDLVYFISSCLDGRACADQAPALLDAYFVDLQAALATKHPGIDGALLEREWRALYPVAWADFCRFLAGWAPDHAKLHGYSRTMTDRALATL